MNEALPTPDTPAVHPAYLRLLCQTLRNLGTDPEPLLRAAGLGSSRQLAGSNDLLPHRSVDRFIRECLRATRRPWLGLELGLAMQLAAHGPLGYAVAASRDLRQALTMVARFAPIRNAALRLRLRAEPRGAAFELVERIDLGDVREFMACVVLATVARVIEAVLGRVPDSIAVDLPFAEPDWRDRIQRQLNGPLRFGAPRLALHVDADLLATPCLTADASAFDRARRECEVALASVAASASFARRVRERLLGAEDEAYPTLAAMAGEFALSQRTLIRRLHDDGTRYQSLLDEVRQQRALWQLQHTRDSVEAIAARLGYEDTSNFSRTFRRWFGVTPSEVRAGVRPAPRTRSG
jgi:AraC-like DNA-binding protein